MCVGKAGRELGKRKQHSRNSMCKGPEAGRNWKEARVAGTQREGVRWVCASLEACPTESGGHNSKAISLDCQGCDDGLGPSSAHGDVENRVRSDGRNVGLGP